jgi:chromosome partitioning protein
MLKILNLRGPHMAFSNIDLSLKEIADIFCVSVQAIHKLVKENDVPLIKQGNSYRITPGAFEAILTIKGIEKVKRTFSSSCVKGGVGKTLLSASLGSRAAMLGHKVLMIDLDQQANLTTAFNFKSVLNETPTLVDVYRGYFQGKKISINDIVVNLAPYLDLIPATLGMAAFETEFNSKTENIGNFFKNLLGPIEDHYDIIWFDCPPALSKITSSAQAYSSTIVVPINTDLFSMDGLELTVDSILSLNSKFGIDPELKIVINKFDARQKLGFEIINILSKGEYKEYLCENFISISKQIDNCIAARQNIWSPKFKSPAQENLSNLLLELLRAETWKSHKSYKTVQPHLQSIQQISEVVTNA